MVATSSIWTFSEGWQREIALWNVGIMFAIIFSLKVNNLEINKFLTITLIVLSLAFGTNHLVSLILSWSFELINFFGVIANYVGAGVGIYIFYFSKKHPF